MCGGNGSWWPLLMPQTRPLPERATLESPDLTKVVVTQGQTKSKKHLGLVTFVGALSGILDRRELRTTGPRGLA